LLIFRPRLDIAEGSLPDETQSEALAKVARNVWVELCLASFILLVVGLLGMMPPAAHS
jgi:putative copper export protein